MPLFFKLARYADRSRQAQIVAKAKQIAKIDCQEPAARVIEQALQARMKKMSALSDRALDWNDPEGVHDMRVASRRLRSALGDFKPYLLKGSIPAGWLRAIAKSLGAVRDEDVVLLALAELESKAGEKVGQGIKAIAEEHDRNDSRRVRSSNIQSARLRLLNFATTFGPRSERRRKPLPIRPEKKAPAES